ncbi:hypothetical protein C6P45_002824 [Maudiozyma exigua]|uniref:Uncharacterized protein n=1 Tax=Maudiozyma exigua TaxID=34358 RepID=A0A9P7B353_MAUEX|nr:hypothetical protein C6P45_002824 [Kazachstania exigua]
MTAYTTKIYSIDNHFKSHKINLTNTSAIIEYLKNYEADSDALYLWLVVSGEDKRIQDVFDTFDYHVNTDKLKRGTVEENSEMNLTFYLKTEDFKEAMCDNVFFYTKKKLIITVEGESSKIDVENELLSLIEEQKISCDRFPLVLYELVMRKLLKNMTSWKTDFKEIKNVSDSSKIYEINSNGEMVRRNKWHIFRRNNC